MTNGIFAKLRIEVELFLSVIFPGFWLCGVKKAFRSCAERLWAALFILIFAGYAAPGRAEPATRTLRLVKGIVSVFVYVSIVRGRFPPNTRRNART
jgi:hypothetical protein